jgi:methionine synthase II (cobalamin-independent)
LLEARDKHAKRDIDDIALREVENAEIEKIVVWQVEQGFG